MPAQPLFDPWLWDRWMQAICGLDYGYWYDALEQTCRVGGWGG